MMNERMHCKQLFPPKKHENKSINLGVCVLNAEEKVQKNF